MTNTIGCWQKYQLELRKVAIVRDFFMAVERHNDFKEREKKKTVNNQFQDLFISGQ